MVKDDDEILKDLYAAEERAKQAEKKLGALTAAAELLEEIPEHVVSEPKSELARTIRTSADTASILRAIRMQNADALVEAHGNVTRSLDDALKLVDQRMLEATAAKPTPPDSLAQIPKAFIEQAVNDHLETRLRIICGRFYQDALGLPGRIRKIDAEFSDLRVRFQALLNRRRLVVEQLIRDDLEAKLDVLRARIERAHAAEDLELLLEPYGAFLDQARGSHDEMDRITEELYRESDRVGSLRTLYMEESEHTVAIMEQVGHIEGIVSFFGVPCPQEISRQLEEVKERIQRLRGQDQQERLALALSFQAITPPWPQSIVRLFENRKKHAAFYLSRLSNPARLFKDSTTKDDAIGRLCVLLALLIEEGKGYGQQTMINILNFSGLAREADHPLFHETLDAMIGFFYVKQKWKNVTVICPTQECRETAIATLESAVDPEGLLHALEDGKRAHWKQKYGERSKTGTDETED